MNIFEQIKNSVYGKVYYQEVVMQESFGQSIKYLAKLSLILALMGSLALAVTLPKFSKVIQKEISVLLSAYPDDLNISIKNGQATVNRPEPYAILIPDSVIEPNDKIQNKLTNLLVINTTEPFSLDKFRAYQTMILLTQKDLVFIDGNTGVKVVSMANFQNLDINKAWLTTKVDWVFKILPLVMSVFVVFAFIGLFLLLFIGSMIVLLFYALLAWAILKIKSRKVDYGRAYQIALHAMTLALPLTIIGFYLQPLNNFFLKILVVLAVIYFNFDKIETPATEIREEMKEEAKEVVA